jgi:4a-hydroxytetrahydrobiopterin dehydratase
VTNQRPTDLTRWTHARADAALGELEGWRRDGDRLVLERRFATFAEALAFVAEVSALAEAHHHHPDICFGWGYATLVLTTHDVGGLTDLDFQLARTILAR